MKVAIKLKYLKYKRINIMISQTRTIQGDLQIKHQKILKQNGRSQTKEIC